MSDLIPIPSFTREPSGQHSSPIESRNNSNNSQSSAASELIIVDPTSIAPFKAFRPSSSVPPQNPAPSTHSKPTSTTKPQSKSTGSSGNSTGHSCTSTCRRIATPGEIAKCGYIAQPVSSYRDKAIYGTPTPSKVQAMDWMRSRYQSDACKTDCVWYHHPDHCEGYPCRGDILYCLVLDRCFFKERCVKHYAMRSRERCIPYNDGLKLGAMDSPSNTAAIPRFDPTSISKASHGETNDASRKRQMSINGLMNDNGKGSKRARPDKSVFQTIEGPEERPASRSNTLDNPPSSRIIPLPPPLSPDLDPSRALLTPASQYPEGESERSGSISSERDESAAELENEEEAEAIDDEMALMWKRLYAQTKDQLDATTIQALQVQDDLATEKEKRVELETSKKKLEKQVLNLKKQLDEINTEAKIHEGESNHKEEADLKIHELNEGLFEALSEIKQLRGRVEKLDKEKEVLLGIRDQGMGMMRDFVERYQNLMKGYGSENEGVSHEGKMK